MQVKITKRYTKDMYEDVPQDPLVTPPMDPTMPAPMPEGPRMSVLLPQQPAEMSASGSEIKEMAILNLNNDELVDVTDGTTITLADYAPEGFDIRVGNS